MVYLEYLRMRKRVVIYALVLAALTLLVIVSSHHSTVEVDGSKKSLHSMVDGIPLSALLGIAGFVTLAMAAFITSINALSDSLPSVWTKPVPRERIALSVFSVDALAIVAFFAIAVAANLAVVASLGVFDRLVFDPQVVPVTLVGLGAAFMAYGNAQAATAWVLGRGGMIAGILFASYLVVIILSIAPLPPILHQIVSTLCIFDPNAYFALTIHNTTVDTQSIFALGIWYRVAIVFGFGIVGCALATFGWKRMEI